MREFEVTLRLRNNLIKKRRVERGLSVRSAAEQAEIPYAEWLRYEGLKLNPIGKGAWRRGARRMAAFFGCLEEDLFPEAVLAIKNPVAVAEIEADRALALAGFAIEEESRLISASSEDSFADTELRGLCRSALSLVTRREKIAVEGWLAEEAFEAIGKRLGVSGERTRQIVARALGKIRRSTVGRDMEGFITR